MVLSELVDTLAAGELFQVFGEECEPYTYTLVSAGYGEGQNMRAYAELQRLKDFNVISVFQTAADDENFAKTAIGIEIAEE